MIIKVTEEDIKRGDKSSSQSCPIALALRAAKLDCRVTLSTIEKAEMVTIRNGDVFSGVSSNCSISTDYVTYSAYKVWRLLSKECQDFIYNFDKGLPVEPFEFEV